MASKYIVLQLKNHDYNKILNNFIVVLLILGLSLGITVFGYLYFCDLDCIDGLLNARMLLTTIGLINVASSNGAKLFALLYSHYNSQAFLASVAVVLAPVLHRFLHQFHLDTEA